VLNKDIRELSKRVNHGSNNNLTSWQKFIDILGIELVLNAQKLLKLDPTWTIRQVAEYLVHSYDRAYPTLRTDYYDYLVHTVESTRLLIGQTGWTRYCFGHPSKVKTSQVCLCSTSSTMSKCTMVESFLEEDFL